VVISAIILFCHLLKSFNGLRFRPQWAGAQLFDFSCHFFRIRCEFSSHRRGNVYHLQALTLQTDFFNELLRIFHSAAGVGITFQVMAVTGQSTGYEYTICAILESTQNV